MKQLESFLARANGNDDIRREVEQCGVTLRRQGWFAPWPQVLSSELHPLATRAQMNQRPPPCLEAAISVQPFRMQPSCNGSFTQLTLVH